MNGSLNYCITLQLELFCQKSGKWDKMPYLEVFLSLRDKETELKGNKLMVRRKGNFHVKDRRSDLGEGPGRSRYYDHCKLVRVPTAPGGLLR